MNITNLHNYQITAYKHIIDNDFCGLMMKMGLGKTVSTLTAINILMYEELEVGTVLVVAPKRVIETVWTDECDKWDHLKHLKLSRIIGNKQQRIDAINKKADIYLISRDNFAWLVAYFNNKLPYDMYIFDELSSFKSYKSVRFKAAKLIRPYCKRVVGLTGTPAPNGLIDLWAQMFIIDRGQRLEKTITAYREKYFRPGLTKNHVVMKYEITEGSEKAIHDKISDICISMDSMDFLELPERIDNYVHIKLTDELKKQYDDFEKDKVLELINNVYVDEESGDAYELLNEISVANAAALSNKLLQFANGAVYDDDKNYHVIHDLKIQALKDIIDDANGENIIVVWSYRHDLERLKIALKQYNIRELKTEADIRDWNNGLINIFLLHPASAGHGLNLQKGGSIIVWFGLTWSLELYQQMVARLHRQGQENIVTNHHLVIDNTHDIDVLKAIESKDRRQENLMKAIKAKIINYAKKLKL